MYLTGLKLHGFKSFADPTQLKFERGVTAVVGPNGCGKSNIADAVRWVLGEQSAKALRGGKMQDVIFEGSDSRKPHALCEVSLLLTDCEKQLGSEFNEIEITRRVSRDGQGEYFFNGRACRLKDIQKLFMDTGVGRTSYSIMAQGQIDQILSSKPEERRAVFEEAAGITRYKSQRREALNKLALVETNLARVADVVGEVGRQIGSLKRQAAKAVRYRKISHRLRRLQLAESGCQFGRIRVVVAELETRVAALRQETENRRSTLAGEQGSLEEKKAERSRLNQRVQEAQQAVFDLRSQKEQAENRANLARTRKTGLADRMAASTDDLAELEMQLKEVSEQADSGAHDKQTQLSLLGSSDALFQDKNRELAIVDGELSQAEQRLQKERFHLLQIESSVARLRTDCSALEVDQKTNQHRHEALVGEVALVRETLAAATQELEQSRVRVEDARRMQTAAHDEAGRAHEGVARATTEYKDAQRRMQEIDRALAQKTARLKVLQQLQERWEGFGEGAKALLQGRLAPVLDGGEVRPITRDLRAKPEYAKALEALLGAAAEAVAVADLDTAQRILSFLEQEKIGSAFLQAAPGGRVPPAPGPLPDFLRPALAMIEDPDASHPAATLLAGCYLADSLDAFLAFWRENSGFDFIVVATPKGEWVDRRGLIFGGHQKKPANSIVQREIDLRETAREAARDQKDHDRQRELIERLGGVLAEAEALLEERRKDVLASAQQVSTLQAEEKNAQRKVEETAGRLRRMEADLQTLEKGRSEAEARLAKARSGLEDAEGSTARQKESITALELRLTELRTDRDGKKEALAQARLELAERRQKVEVLDRGLGEMERRRVQLTDLLEQRREEVALWTEQVAELEREAESESARGAEIVVTLKVAQASVEEIRAALLEVERSISAIEERQSSLRQEADSAQQELSRCEVRLAENRSRLGFLVEDIQREYQVQLEAIDWKLELWHAEDEPEGLKPLDLEEEEDPAPRGGRKGPRSEPTQEDLQQLDSVDWEQIRAEIAALRQRIQGMGAVNLVAIEEYSELKERFEFLKTQSDDLIGSKQELIKAIDEINRTSQQQFQVTFEQIRKNFAYTFQLLFGGGHAGLQLAESEDVLESGIEIVAQPPGTKLKGISLLSGGQRTLTAVALLFALYMVKPSPFCVLDELDAPLDESNIGRFTHLLRQFTADSQFIIITHNKRTIAAADAIYGVTMEEKGVSKTVSMRFHAETHAEIPA